MRTCIAIDLTRLSIGPAWPTPRGIDRVDIAYADRFLERWPGDCVATLSLPWASHVLDRGRALRLLRTVERVWGEAATPAEDPIFAKVRAGLDGGRVAPPARASQSRCAAIHRAAVNVLKCAGIPLGASAVSKVPEGAVYLNTGQIGIADARFLSWLNRRADVRPVFMLHDTIPIDYPEHVPVHSARYHQKMIDNAARYARGLIVTTRSAEDDIRRALELSGRTDMDIAAAPLPPSAAFQGLRAESERVSDVPYFVICGAIEPRKNHLLLLNVWRELVRRDGAAAPKLVIVGKRWNTGTEAINMIEQSPSLSGHVIEISGLSTPGLARLLAGAQALLMPSFAEGFGLPIVEALTLGTPVIASNIPAHLEAGGAFATYLSPIDGLGWLMAVRDHLQNNAARRRKLENYLPQTWDRYFDRIDPFLIAMAEGGDQTVAVAAQ
jgi:glycosyltransferase involved in cell wall biosynthesis